MFLRFKRFKVDDMLGNDNTNYILNLITEYAYLNLKFGMYMHITHN